VTPAYTALTSRFRTEHQTIRADIDQLRATADTLDAPGAMTRVRQAYDMLTGEVWPHEAAEEAELYPPLNRLLGGADPTAPMSRAHAEIAYQIARLGRLIDDIGDRTPALRPAGRPHDGRSDSLPAQAALSDPGVPGVVFVVRRSAARGAGSPARGACRCPSATALATRQENAAICRTARIPCGSVSPNSTNPAAIGIALVTMVAVPAAVSASPRWYADCSTLVPVA
jgi:hypothetical protein